MGPRIRGVFVRIEEEWRIEDGGWELKSVVF